MAPRHRENILGDISCPREFNPGFLNLIFD